MNRRSFLRQLFLIGGGLLVGSKFPTKEKQPETFYEALEWNKRPTKTIVQPVEYKLEGRWVPHPDLHGDIISQEAFDEHLKKQQDKIERLFTRYHNPWHKRFYRFDGLDKLIHMEADDVGV